MAELEQSSEGSGITQVPTPAGGGSGTPEQPSADSSQGEESFFDPRNVPDELRGAYKGMQQAYTQKTQAIARDRNKIAAYDEFMRDPHGSIRRVAAEYGMTLQQAQQVVSQVATQTDWVPQDWNEVLTKAAEYVTPRIREEIVGQIQPALQEFQKMKQREIEQTLDGVSPDWRLYEDEMVQLLKQHPSLVNDPSLLAKLAIPESVRQSRAAEEALKKTQRKVESAKHSTSSTTSRTPEPSTDGPMTFNQAVALAKHQLSKKGIVY